VTAWGKAGVRLTPAEVAARAARQRTQRNRNRTFADATETEGYRAWREGRLIPATITLALDAHALTGPEVDVACGAREPDVDRWEAGVQYPSWEQTKLLAELCLVTVEFLTRSHSQLDANDTSLKFHVRASDRQQPALVPFFNPDAIAAATRTAPKELT
jgi:hypothetical protein